MKISWNRIKLVVGVAVSLAAFVSSYSIGNQFGENECDPSKALKCEQLSIDDDEYSTVGFWHIHPDGTDFSDNDRGWIKRQNKGNLPFYLIDKYGQVRKLIPVKISSPSLKDPYLTYIGISVNGHDPRE